MDFYSEASSRPFPHGQISWKRLEGMSSSKILRLMALLRTEMVPNANTFNVYLDIVDTFLCPRFF